MSKTNTEEEIDFINKCLELSIEHDILLEVVYTAFVDNRYNGNITKAFEQSLWYWLLFNAKKSKKIDLQKLQKGIELIKNGNLKQSSDS